MIGVALVAVVLYRPILSLPLIYDTLLHIRIAKSLDWATVWWPTEQFGFYRPMTFLPFLAIRAIFHHYPPLVLQSFNLIQHALNGVLVAWLVHRLTNRLFQSLLAGLLFVCFPFSYQAMAVYGHNVHPAIANLQLLGLHTALTALGRSSRRWWAVTFGSFLLAILTHESAVLFGWLMLLLFLAYRPRNWKTMRWPLAFIVLGGAYLILYQFFPISRAPQTIGDSAVNGAKVWYLLQAAAYPFTGFGHFFPRFSATLVISVGALLTVLMMGGFGRKQLPALFFGWGWWGLAALLIALPLPTTYLLNGPRLLYLSSIGLAIAWSACWPQNRRWQGLILPFFAYLLATNLLFVADRLAQYRQLTSGLDLLRSQQSGGALLINLPQWIAPPRNSYPLGAEFVAQLGDYLFVEEWTEANGVVANPVRAIKLPELLNATPYGYGIHDQTAWQTISADWSPQGSDLYLTRYLEDGIKMERFGRFIPQVDSATLVTIEPYTLHTASAEKCGQRLIITTSWSEDSAELPTTTSMFAQAIDKQGALIGQVDRPMLGIAPIYLTVPTGWGMVDVRELKIEDSAELDHVLIGFYNYLDGKRYPTLPAFPNDAYPLPITPCAQLTPQ